MTKLSDLLEIANNGTGDEWQSRADLSQVYAEHPADTQGMSPAQALLYGFALAPKSWLQAEQNHEPRTLQASLPDTKATCSARELVQLRQILYSHEHLLELWLKNCIAADKRIPEKYLTLFIDDLKLYGSRSSKAYDLVSQVLGERGVWLAQQGRPWNRPHPTNTSQTSQAHKQKTVFTFRTYRISNEICEYLTEEWKRAYPKSDQIFWNGYSFALRAEYEPFLTRLLTYSDSQLQQLGHLLLLYLPSSKLVERLATIIEHFIDVEGESNELAQLKVTLPTRADLAEFYFNEEKGWHYVGALSEGELLLNQVMAALPLTYWTRKGHTPAQIITIIEQSVYAPALKSGLLEAVNNQSIPAWKIAFLQSLANQEKYPYGSLFEGLSYQQIEQLLLESLAASPDALRDIHYTRTLITHLAKFKQGFSQTLSETLMQQLFRILNLSDLTPKKNLPAKTEMWMCYLDPDVVDHWLPQFQALRLGRKRRDSKRFIASFSQMIEFYRMLTREVDPFSDT